MPISLGKEFDRFDISSTIRVGHVGLAAGSSPGWPMAGRWTRLHCAAGSFASWQNHHGAAWHGVVRLVTH